MFHVAGTVEVFCKNFAKNLISQPFYRPHPTHAALEEEIMRWGGSED
jgi:hypothetical protein